MPASACLDSVNYVTDPKKPSRPFSGSTPLLPGGLFLFDVNTVEKLSALDGQVFLDETEDTLAAWRAEYSKRSRICSYFMDLFRLDEESGQWERGEELHRERAYTVEELTGFLPPRGFLGIKACGDKMRAPRPGEQRVFFVAKKGQKVKDQWQMKS